MISDVPPSAIFPPYSIYWGPPMTFPEDVYAVVASGNNIATS